MKKLITFIFLLCLSGCKNDPEKAEDPAFNEITNSETDSLKRVNDELEFLKEHTKILKTDALFSEINDREEMKELIISKSYLKIKDCYTLNIKYPLLNEDIKRSYVNFNTFISDEFINIDKMETDILEKNDSICDTTKTKYYPEIRRVDYKIYIMNGQIISLLFYKENYYSGQPLPAYTFETLNFDLQHSVFLQFEDFFKSNSEEQVRHVLNDILEQKIKSGTLYYDCWKISATDFYTYKNNFVLIDGAIAYYFDDCIICPSYTGTFSVKIPLDSLKPFLKNYTFDRNLY